MFKRCCINLSLFAGGLAFFMFATHTWIREMGGCQIRYEEAFQTFRDQKNSFDVVFTGSSYTAVQIDPRVFDARCAEHGFTIRSINLGSQGATFYKIDDLLRLILDENPERLRYVIIDPREAEGIFREGEIGMAGSIRWHTFLQTRRAIARGWNAKASMGTRLRSGCLHMIHFLRNVLHLGCANLIVDPPASSSDVHPGLDFVYGELTGDSRGKQSTKLEQMIERYSTFDAVRSVELFDLAALDEQVELLEDHGVIPVFVATPALKMENLGIRRLAEEGRIPHVIALDDVASYPGLYEIQNRNKWDYRHLAQTREAIQLYTGLLADRFVESVLESSGTEGQGWKTSSPAVSSKSRLHDAATPPREREVETESLSGSDTGAV